MSENAPASAAKKVSEDPMDYASLILYVKRGVPVCEELLGFLAGRLDVIVQDVDGISGQRPPWLKGVPTAVELPHYNVLTGTQAVKAVQSLSENSIQGVGSALPGAPQEGAYVSGSATRPAGLQGLFTLDNEAEGRAAPPPPSALGLAADPEGRYEDVPKEKTNATTLEEMMRRRGGSATAP